MQNILKTTLNIRPALIETPEFLWNNLAPSASPLLALGSDLSNKGSGAALPSDTKSEQLLLDCANRLISFSIVGCCSWAKLKIYATSKLWREDSKFSLPQKKHKSEMYTPYFFLWETLVQALNRALLFKYGSHLVTRWLLVCNTFWGVRKIPNLQTSFSTLSYFDSVSHFSSRADLDSSINSFRCTKPTSMPHASFHLYLFELHFYQQFLLNIGLLISKRFLQNSPAFIIKIIRQTFEPLTRYKDLYVLLQCIVLLPLKSCHADLCISGAIHPLHMQLYTHYTNLQHKNMNRQTKSVISSTLPHYILLSVLWTSCIIFAISWQSQQMEPI